MNFQMEHLPGRCFAYLIACIQVCFIGASMAAFAEVPISAASGFLPDAIGSFHANGAAAKPGNGISNRFATGDFNILSDASRPYTNEAGNRLIVESVCTDNDDSAYALLTRLRNDNERIETGEVGMAAIVTSSHLAFYKGSTLIDLSPEPGSTATQDQLLTAAQLLAANMPNGDDDIPVLVAHLPNSASVATYARYAVTLNGLKNIVGDESILDALNFEGGAEAVAAPYGRSLLVLVEFTTPQLSIDNDQHVVARIQDLRGKGQPLPSAYRRVGNYSVFVFNAADEKTANDLIDQVKYQQVVQWLGEDPHLYEKLQRYFANTSAGVLVAVLESSGLSLVVCLGLGALLGGMLFRYRRAQQAASYSDAGGTVRLNLDDITSTSSPHLLRSGGTSRSDSHMS